MEKTRGLSPAARGGVKMKALRQACLRRLSGSVLYDCEEKKHLLFQKCNQFSPRVKTGIYKAEFSAIIKKVWPPFAVSYIIDFCRRMRCLSSL